MAGHKTWAIGEEVIASEFGPFVSDQIVAVFASAAARTAGWATPPTGALSYLLDQARYETYNGTAWVDIANATKGALGELARDERFVISGAFSTVYTSLLGLEYPVRAGRRYRAHFHGRHNLSASGVVQFTVRQGPPGTPVDTSNSTQLALHAATISGNGTSSIDGTFLATANTTVRFAVWGTCTVATTMQGTTNDPWGLYLYDEGAMY